MGAQDASEAREGLRPSLPARASLVPERAARSPSLRTVTACLLLAALALDFVYPMQGWLTPLLLSGLSALLLPWAHALLRSSGREREDPVELLVLRLSLLALALLLLSAKWWLWLATPVASESFRGSSRSYGVALAILVAAGAFGRSLRLARFSAVVSERPARLIMASFAGVGVLGGLVLSLPVSLQHVHQLSMVDNLFMAFSAVCVTGLSVNNLSTTYTWFGQGVLCLLIQVGGLGIMVLSAAVALFTGQRLRVKSSAVLAESVDADSIAQLRKVISGIIASTFLIEIVGALILYARFSSLASLPSNGGGPAPASRGEAAWAAIFHAVSAFCNAGFSSFAPGLEPFVGDPLVLGPVTSLIVLGGIGFPVIQELAGRGLFWFLRRRRERLSLHARVALRSTGLLLVAMTLAYLLLEGRGTLQHLGWFERALAALFHSASCRTAGFSVVDLGTLQPASVMLTCIAMFIGACPGSCAGGIKTTTVAVMFAGLRSELDGRPARLFDRTLPSATTRKAIGVVFMSAALLSVMLFLLLLVEPHRPLELAFEAFSAFSTTGLSMGVTPKLSIAGKILVLLTMYFGRIGPLTLALAVSGRVDAPPVQLPSERVLIG
ncbi:MAG TPA: potassium transporter TrkG [Polyangiaceae bacterium]|nr:potassium transporter TrkG [Polyangiaceae bacterium]